MATDLFNSFVDDIFDGNQSRAADALGLDKSTVSRLCSGTRAVTPPVAQKVEELSAGRYRKEALIWPEQADAA